MTAAKLAATAAALILGLTGAVAGLGGLTHTSPTCTARDDGAPVAELSVKQASNARVIVAVGQERGVPARVCSWR